MKTKPGAEKAHNILDRSSKSYKPAISLLTLSSAAYILTGVVIVAGTSFASNKIVPGSIEYMRTEVIGFVAGTAMFMQFTVMSWLLSYIWRQNLYIKYGNSRAGKWPRRLRGLSWVAFMAVAIATDEIFSSFEDNPTASQFYTIAFFVLSFEFLILMATRALILYWEL